MNRMLHLKEVVPVEFTSGLRKRAEHTLQEMYQDYFSDKSFAEFQRAHLGHDSLVMKLVTYRFASNDVMLRLKDFLKNQVKEVYGSDDLMLHPVFYLRFSFPGIHYSPKHRDAFLDTQPHYDRAFGIEAFSFWLALDEVNGESGGLCSFETQEIEEHFNIPWGEKNRYNYTTYLEASDYLDPMLKRGVVAPSISAGDILTFGSNMIHGATKPQTRRRVSFDFRLVPEMNVRKAPESSQTVFNEINKGFDVCNAQNLIVFGDFLGASRILEKVAAEQNNLGLLSVATALRHTPPKPELLKPGARVPWQEEYKWLFEANAAY